MLLIARVNVDLGDFLFEFKLPRSKSSVAWFLIYTIQHCFLASTLFGTSDAPYSTYSWTKVYTYPDILESWSHIFPMTPNTHTLGPLEQTLPCLAPSCIRRFYNRTGHSNHMRSQHLQFVPDLQQQMNTLTSSNSIPSSQTSSPPTCNTSLDSHSESGGSDHKGHNNHNDYNDHNSTDESPVDDLSLDIPCDGEEYYQHLNGHNQSPGISNAGSYDQAHDPAVFLIRRTYHPIINGGFLVLLLIFHIYS